MGSEPPAGARLEIGRVTRPHGLRGEVVVEPISNRRERFEPGAVHHAEESSLFVAAARPLKSRWVVAYEGVVDRNAAEDLRGVLLTGDPIDVLDEGEMWAHELVGAEVVDGDGRPRGTVVEVEVNPAHDLLVLDTGALVPVVFVREFDGERVRVDVPEGLLDDEFVAANRPGVERRRPDRKGGGSKR